MDRIMNSTSDTRRESPAVIWQAIAGTHPAWLLGGERSITLHTSFSATGPFDEITDTRAAPWDTQQAGQLGHCLRAFATHLVAVAHQMCKR